MFRLDSVYLYAMDAYETNILFLVELRGLDAMATVRVQVYVQFQKFFVSVRMWK